MNRPLLIIIKFYWLIVPKDKRRTCLYKKSCSNHVYEVTNSKGLVFGLKALILRFKTCRANHEIIRTKGEETIKLKLSNGTILQQNEISWSIISSDKYKMDDNI